MDISALSGVTGAFSKAGLTAGTTTTYSTGAATAYAIDGKAYSVAAQTNTATPTLDGVTGAAFLPVNANQGSIFIHGFNAAGTLVVCQGSIESLDAAGNFINAPRFPSLPKDFAPFAYLVLKVGSTGSAWTYGASNQAGATGVTYTRQDLMGGLPSRLQIS